MLHSNSCIHCLNIIHSNEYSINITNNLPIVISKILISKRAATTFTSVSY